MKANEAPEKIYVNITHPISDEYTEIIAFEDGDGIEYTRTDAFIENACGWLNKELYTRFSGNEHFVASSKAINLQEFIKNFKNYMKGE